MKNVSEGVDKFLDVVTILYVIRTLTSVIVQTKPQQHDKPIFFEEGKLERFLVEEHHFSPFVLKLAHFIKIINLFPI